MKLKDKVAIVVGGAGGIGKMTSQLLAGEGAKVVIADMDIETAEKLAGEINNGTGEAMAFKIDTTHPEEAEAMVQAAIAAFGQVDILVNHAGGSVGRFIREKLGPFAESSKEEWDRILDVNLTGTRNCARAVINHMMERGTGKIVNTSSTAGVTGLRNAVDYSAAKAGVIGFTRALAMEAAPHGIQVNCISPGGVATERIAKMFAKAMEEANPGRPGMDMEALVKPEEIAAAVLFLVSDDAPHLVGENIIVAGSRQS